MKMKKSELKSIIKEVIQEFNYSNGVLTFDKKWNHQGKYFNSDFKNTDSLMEIMFDSWYQMADRYLGEIEDDNIRNQEFAELAEQFIAYLQKEITFKTM